MTDPVPLRSPAQSQPVLFWGFIVLMVGLMASFVWLGTWQMQRLAEKEALIARVESRLDAAPLVLATSDDWSDPDDLEFRPVQLSGTFRHDQTVRVFTSLASGQARGPATGPGYWWLTPLEVPGGGTVLVNRGFVPEGLDPALVAAPEGAVVVEGIARRSEPASWFTLEPDSADRLEWVRDTDRLATMLPEDLLPVAPITVDQSAGPTGTFPQGGETVIEFPNNHLGYAITWYGFALLTPIMLGFWIWRQRRPADALPS